MSLPDGRYFRSEPSCLPSHRVLVAAIVSLGLSLGSGCGLESCAGVGNFEPTPEPEAEIRGVVDDVPDALRALIAEEVLDIRAVNVDGAVVAQVDGRLGEPFALRLGPGVDHFNLRIVVRAGGVVLKDFASEAAAGDTLDIGVIGAVSTAAAQVVERYATRERQSLASTPPGTLLEVLNQASSDDPAVVAFRDLVITVLAALVPGDTTEAIDADGYGVAAAALAQIGSSEAAYLTSLDAAVDASVVPVVCDPTQIRVLFTVDVSGQAKDGNGAAQFIRQPSKEGKVYLGITLDPSSPVPDSAGALRPRLTPNDVATEMWDDGSHGDEQAGDGVFSTTVDLLRGMRVLYKYTNGSAGEGFTGTEEWPGNARILQLDDVLTGTESGTPDCLIIRRDAFGDESSNKNFVNLHARLGGADLDYDTDLGGLDVGAPDVDGIRVGGATIESVRLQSTLTPAGVPEARENGICQSCPAPLTVSADDDSPPRLVAAAFTATDRTRVVFSEDVDVQTAGLPENYLLVDEQSRAIVVRTVQVTGGSVVLQHDPVDPRIRHRVSVKDITDASLAQNRIADGAQLAIAADLTPPVVEEVRAGSIVELNAAARPVNPESGELVIVRFSEILDRVAAENAASYAIDGLEVFAAFQRGREVLLVTSPQERGAAYTLEVGDVFDVAGNVMRDTEALSFRGLSLVKVTFRAVVDFAWTSVDGSTKGLPDDDGLYLTGTVLKEARGLDGRDLRVTGRTDVAGIEGFRFEPTEERFQDATVYALSLRLPSGTYAYKLAHGAPADAFSPPATLETVSKSLATRNDVAGVVVDPVSLRGADGFSYQQARLSLSGQDSPGRGILFKRENPDEVVFVGDADRELGVQVLGTWRDVPFGRNADYDDGLPEMALTVAGAEDLTPPRLVAVRARDSESVVVSFDEAVQESDQGLMARVTGDEGELMVQEAFVAQPLPNQLVLRVSTMDVDQSYSLMVGGVQDLSGNVMPSPETVGFTSPGQSTPFTPLVDDVPPEVTAVTATSPTEIDVLFSERLNVMQVDLADFTLSQAGEGTAPQLLSVRMEGGGVRAVLTTTPQERQAPYSLEIGAVEDLAGNLSEPVTLSVVGFGEFDPPQISWAKPVTPTLLAVRFDERVSAATAGDPNRYAIDGLSIVGARFGAADELRGAAFNPTWAPLAEDLVLLEVAPMQVDVSYALTATGVEDLSGNPSAASASFVGINTAPRVDVLLTYQVSDTAGVLGVGPGGTPASPARALSPSTLQQQREGLFILGTALDDSGASPIASHPATLALGGFPDEGAPLDGVEPQLRDDGTEGDVLANDNIFTLRIPDVPLGSTVSWKAFASFTTAFGQQNPQVPGAAFADASPGPSVFSDGQEYPGNDNAVLLVADADGDGVIHIDNLFGDEITFKRTTGRPAFHLAVDRARRRE